MKGFSERDVLDRAFTVLLSHDAATRKWLAHCLEFDMVEDGKTEEEALLHLLRIMKSNVRDAVKHGTVRDLFQFAPKEYWMQAIAAKPVPLEEVLQPERISPFFVPSRKLDLKMVSSRA